MNSHTQYLWDASDEHVDSSPHQLFKGSLSHTLHKASFYVLLQKAYNSFCRCHTNEKQCHTVAPHSSSSPPLHASLVTTKKHHLFTCFPGYRVAGAP